MDPEPLTQSTIIYSPRHIANAQGRWIGTVGEALAAATDVALGNLETRLYEEAAFSARDIDYGFTPDAHLHLLTPDHLRDLLDDPNIEALADEVIHEIGRHRPEAFGYVAYPMGRDFWQLAADYDETAA